MFFYIKGGAMFAIILLILEIAMTAFTAIVVVGAIYLIIDNLLG